MSRELHLSPRFSELWQGKDPFEEVEKLEGEVYREIDGRTTLRFELDGKGYFLKVHRGVGWLEIFKNLIQLRMPVLGAENEWKAIDKLKSIGVDTMTYVAYGKQGINPATQLSFVITEDLAGCVSLEDYFLGLSEAEKSNQRSVQLLDKLANSIRVMHQGGINHRDLYICHFLFDPNLNDENIRLYVIDLHRTQIRQEVPYRWLVKDMASVIYSLKEVEIGIDHIQQFSSSSSQSEKVTFWSDVMNRAEFLLKKDKKP